MRSIKEQLPGGRGVFNQLANGGKPLGRKKTRVGSGNEAGWTFDRTKRTPILYAAEQDGSFSSDRKSSGLLN
jgi:hypothetical protein